MADRLDPVWRVLRQPSLRRLMGAFALFSIAENGTWISVTVFAFQRGGVAEAGLVAVVQLAPAVVIAPFAAYAGDRFRKDRVLTAGYVVQATTMLATAAAMWVGAAAPVVYMAATAAAVAVTFTRPAMGALLPAATHTPADLTAANVLLGVLEHLGVFLGPALAGLLMYGGEPAQVFTVMGAAMAVAALAVARLHLDTSVFAPTGDVDAGDIAGEALAGFRALANAPDVRLIVLVLTVDTLIIGATDVLFVAVADRLTDGDSAARAGLFGAAFGLGALAAAVLSVVLVGRSRLATVLAVAVLASSVALAMLGLTEAVVVALGLFAVCGSGESIAKITGATLVQRVAPTAVLSRIFGIVEGLAMAALAAGAVGASLLIGRFGLRNGVLVLGFVVGGLVVVQGPRLWALDQRTPRPRSELVDLVRGQEMFALLSAPALERLLASLETVTVSAGAVVMRQGDLGDRFYIVEAGELAVTVDGRPARTLTAGDGFGEIALIRDVPRTATVTATIASVLQALRSEDFLAALGAHRGLSLAEERSEALLAEDRSRRGEA